MEVQNKYSAMNSHLDVIEKIINDTREFINDRHLFKDVIENFYDSVEHINQRRLCKWLTFFIENYSKSPCIFSYSVYALFEAIEKMNYLKLRQNMNLRLVSNFTKKYLIPNSL